MLTTFWYDLKERVTTSKIAHAERDQQGGDEGEAQKEEDEQEAPGPGSCRGQRPGGERWSPQQLVSVAVRSQGFQVLSFDLMT